MKKGFTLVELSIVLVIIGLLVGGILVGQSLIESAKMQSFVRQIQQYDAAGQQFKSKFRQLPGDAKVFLCSDGLDGTNLAANSSSGEAALCNNGRVEAYKNNDDYLFYGETKNYWKDMFVMGIKQDNGSAYTDVISNSTVAAGVNVPKAQIGTNAGVGVYFTNGRNFYIIESYQDDAIDKGNSAISAVDALAYDAKVDDGAADDGNVISGGATGCNTGANYEVDSGSDIVCNLEIDLFANGSV